MTELPPPPSPYPYPYPAPPGYPGGPHPPAPPPRPARGFFIAGGVLGIIASANLFLVGAALQALARRGSALDVAAALSVTGIVLASLSLGGRRWAALGSALLQLAVLVGVLSLPLGGYRVLAALAAPVVVPLSGGYDGALGAFLLLGMLGLIQVPLSLLSAIFSLVAQGRAGR